MLADATTVPDGEIVRTDVCIIGAGPVGITLARELSAAKVDVVLLERGSSDPGSEREDPGTIVNVGLRYPLPDTRAFGIGGSIHSWLVDTPFGGGMGRLRELDEEDFQHRDWIPYSGWPFSKDELRPYYPRARALFDSSPPGTRDDDSWDAIQADSRLTGATGRICVRTFTFGNPAVFASEHRRQLEHRDSVLVLTNAVAATMQGYGRQASGVTVVTEGTSFTVVARTYVLAAGALETARILLCSQWSDSQGLGNEYDLVGRFFMEHPHYTSGLLIPQDEGLYAEGEEHRVYLREGIAVQRKYGLAPEVERQEGLQRSVLMLHPTVRSARLGLLGYSDRGARAIHQALDLRDRIRSEGITPGSVAAAVRSAPSAPYVLRFGTLKVWERLGRRAGWRRFTHPQAFKMTVMAEQLPNPESRLTLTPRRDRFGLAIGALDWRLRDEEVAGLRRTQTLIGAAFEDAVSVRVRSLLDRRESLPGLIGGAHHMGTTRMHDSPRHGVVDRHGRLHSTTNVYVAGGATFPTVGYANPTLTTLALALRLADHLLKADR